MMVACEHAARIVNNPFLGTGLVAGYRTSGESQRPGFAWFFGRDSLWTSLALNAAGDFATTRTALQFISKYQREDGRCRTKSRKVQASFLVQGFSLRLCFADATPLYIIAMNDYVTRAETLLRKRKMGQRLEAYNSSALLITSRASPRISASATAGWRAARCCRWNRVLSKRAGRHGAARAVQSGASDWQGFLSAELARDFEKQARKVNDAFWLAGKQRYALALGTDGKPIDEPSVLATVLCGLACPNRKMRVL